MTVSTLFRGIHERSLGDVSTLRVERVVERDKERSECIAKILAKNKLLSITEIQAQLVEKGHVASRMTIWRDLTQMDDPFSPKKRPKTLSEVTT